MIFQGLIVYYLLQAAAAITDQDCVMAGLTLCRQALHCKKSCNDSLEPPKCPPTSYFLCGIDLQCKALQNFQCGKILCNSQTFCPSENICKPIDVWTEACLARETLNASVAQKPCLDHCKCSHAVEGLQACYDMDRRCQTMLQDPRSFFANISQIDNEMHPCLDGHVYCPKQGTCISNTSTCRDQDDANHRTLIQSCLPCAADQRFFPALQRCIPMSDFENFQSRFQRFLGGLKEAFDDQCRVGEKFCAISSTCVPKNQSCELPVEMLKNACPKNETRYCVHRGLCLNITEPCQNVSMAHIRTSYGNNYTNKFIGFCQARGTLCARAVFVPTECRTQQLNRLEACPSPTKDDGATGLPTINPRTTGTQRASIFTGTKETSHSFTTVKPRNISGPIYSPTPGKAANEMKYLLLNQQSPLRDYLRLASMTNMTKLSKSLFAEGQWFYGEREADTPIKAFPVEIPSNSYLRFQRGEAEPFGAAAVLTEYVIEGRVVQNTIVDIKFPDPFLRSLIDLKFPPTIIAEDSEDGGVVRVSDVVGISEQPPVSDLPSELVANLSATLVETFKLRKALMNSVETVIVLTGHSATWMEGIFFLNENGSGIDWKPILSIASASPVRVSANSLIKFQPVATFSGTVSFTLDLQVVLASVNKMMQIPSRIRHVFRILNSNNRPVLTSNIAYLFPVPYDLQYNEGFFIRELVNVDPNGFRSGTEIDESEKPVLTTLMRSLATDSDSNDIGIAINATYNSSSIGQWMYVTSVDRNWKPVPARFEKSAMLLLAPEARLKFVLNNPTRHWTTRDAVIHTGIQFFAWDGTDNQTEGVRRVDVASKAYSAQLCTGFILRLGCDRIVGSLKVSDQNGECCALAKGCRKCDGTTNSSAEIDNCQNCVLGITKRAFDDRKDVFGRCCQAELDKCQVCQASNVLSVSLADCNGDCRGRAITNKCGQCVGGLTGRQLNYGIDRCGRCMQNPLSADLSKACTITMNIPKPTVFSSNQPVEVQVSGTGAIAVASTKCRLFNAISTVAMEQVGLVDVRNLTKDFSFTLRAAAVQAGRYQIGCVFLESGNETVTESGIISVLEPKQVAISKVIPDAVQVDTPVRLTVTGSGFLNQSITYCNFSSVGIREARYVDANTLVCAEVTFRQVQPQKLELVNRLFAIRPSADVKVVCAAPVAVKAEVAQDWSQILVTFNKPAGLTGTSSSCEEILDSQTYSLCGEMSVCRMQGRVSMGIRCQSSVITVNMTSITSICINKNQVQCSGHETIQEDADCQRVPVQFPDISIPPTAVITGPEKSAGCADVVLRGDQSKAGVGANLKYLWTVEYAGASPSSEEETNKLAALREDFKKGQPIVVMKENFLSNGRSYVIRLTVTNEVMKKAVAQLSLVIDNSEVKPKVAIFGNNPRMHKASNELQIKPMVELSRCEALDASSTLLSFFWTIEPNDITFANSERNLFIKGGTLTPGTLYKVTLTVSLTSNPNVFASATVQVNVTASPLRVRINKGSRTMYVDCLSSVELEAVAADPDNTDDKETLQWECKDTKTGQPCMDYSDPDAIKPLLLPSESKVVVAKGILECNSIYEFTVTYIKGERKAQASVALHTVDNSPKISCRPPSFVNRNSLGGSQDVVLSCSVRSMSQVSAAWSMLITKDSSAFDLSDEEVVKGSLMENFTTQFPIDQSYGGEMKIKIRSDAFIAQVLYVFKVSASNEFASAEADVEVTVPPKPIAGTLSVDPAEGYPTTAFNLKALDFVGEGLTYTFGYFHSDSEDPFLGRVILAKNQDANILTGIKGFSEGDLTVYVQAKSNADEVALATCNLSVDASPERNATVLSSAVSETLAVAQELIQNGDKEKALRELSALAPDVLKAMGSVCEAKSSSERLMLDDFISKSLKSVSSLRSYNQGHDHLGQTLPLLKLLTMDVCSEMLPSPSRDGDFVMVAQTLLDMLMVGNKQDASIEPSRRRRRRSADDPSTSSGSPFPSVPDILNSLEVFSNLIDPHRFDGAALTTKKSFMQLLPGYLQALSYHSQASEAMQVAVENLTTLNVGFMTFTETTTVETDDEELKIDLGSVLQSRLQFWNCSSESGACAGAYVGLIKMIDDLLSNEEDKNFVLVTDVVGIYLVNPVTFDLLDETDLENTLQVQLQAWNINQTVNVQCYMWQEENATWVEDECTTSVLNESSVTCTCSRTGFIAAFEYIAPEIEVITVEEKDTLLGLSTTVSTTTLSSSASSSSNTTNTFSSSYNSSALSSTEKTNTSSSGVTLHRNSSTSQTQPATAATASTFRTTKSGEVIVSALIVFTENYPTIVGQYGESTVVHKIRLGISSALGIDPDSIIDLKIREGSIIAEFLLLLSRANKTSALADLFKAVKDNSLAVTFGDGVKLNSDPHLLVDGKDYAPTKEPSDDKKKTAIIIIAIILGIGLIIVVIFIVIYCKQKSRKVSPSPDSSQAELHKEGKKSHRHHEDEKQGTTDRGHYNPVFHAQEPNF